MLLRLIALVLLGYAALCGLAFWLQDRLIFLPRDQQVATVPAQARPVAVQRPDATLRGWIVNPGAAGPLLVYFGGNAEELSATVTTFARLDATTALINYRGFGHSDGNPGAAALVADARAVVKAARQRWGDGRPLILFGRSLGSGIAALASDAVSVDGLVLMSPYRSLEALARRKVPFLPVAWLLRHHIDTTAAVRHLPPRVLVLHGQRDLIIPAAESRAFIERLDDPAVVTFRGSHNVALTDPQIWPHLVDFVAGFHARTR